MRAVMHTYMYRFTYSNYFSSFRRWHQILHDPSVRHQHSPVWKRCVQRPIPHDRQREQYGTIWHRGSGRSRVRGSSSEMWRPEPGKRHIREHQPRHPSSSRLQETRYRLFHGLHGGRGGLWSMRPLWNPLGSWDQCAGKLTLIEQETVGPFITSSKPTMKLSKDHVMSSYLFSDSFGIYMLSALAL